MGAQDAKQYFAVFVVNLYMLVYGIFISSVDIDYQNHFNRMQEEGDFDFQEYESASREQLVMFFVGPFVGGIFFGYIAMKCGRKAALLYMPIPMIMSCLINLFVREFVGFGISIVLGGLFGGGVCVVGPLYLIEIVAKDRYRGAILTSLVLSEMLGEVLAFSGDLLMNNNIVIACTRIVLMVVASTLVYRYLTDTPLSLIKRKKFEEAETSIMTYKNIRKTDANHADTLRKEFDRIKNVVADSDLEANQLKALCWADFKTKYARKVLAIVIVLAVLNVCSSNANLAVHTSIALTQYPMSISYESGRWIVSIVYLVGAYVAVQTVDRIGRKVLITVSAVATSVALISNVAHTQLVRPSYGETSSQLISAITLLMAIFFGALGIRSLTFAICVEILNHRIKDVSVIFCGAFLWLFSYVFHAIFFSAGSEVVALISAILCLVGSILMHLLLPETKSKSYQEIMKSF